MQSSRDILMTPLPYAPRGTKIFCRIVAEKGVSNVQKVVGHNFADIADPMAVCTLLNIR